MRFATDIPLSVIPYNKGDSVFQTGTVLFRPDDWDAEFYPHVLLEPPPPGS